MKRWIKNRAVELMLATILGAYIISSLPNKGNYSEIFEGINTREYYMINTYEETGGGNIVAGIYLEYRLFDSILEAGVLLVSASGIIFISKKDHEV